jgi:hypothetical protein
VAIFFPVALYLKVDTVNPGNFDWGVIFLPVWVLNCMIFIGLMVSISWMDWKTFKKYWLPTLLKVILTFTFTFMLCLRLDGLIDWSYGLIFIPAFGIEFVVLVEISVSISFKQYKSLKLLRDRHAFFGLGYVGFLIREYTFWALRVTFLIMLVLKLSEYDVNWWIVGLPIIVSFVFVATAKISDAIAAHYCFKDDETQPGKLRTAIFTLLLISLFLTSKFHSILIIFIPVFIFCGLILSCVLCCTPIICCILTPPQRPRNATRSSLTRSSTTPTTYNNTEPENGVTINIRKSLQQTLATAVTPLLKSSNPNTSTLENNGGLKII